jgi:CheY-like chemotaxis protein
MSQKEDETLPQAAADKPDPVKVTLAEDDREDQQLFQDALDKTGTNAELTVVNNGQELVNSLKDPEQEKPDIIFIDINMPVKDGKEALKEIKKDEELKEIPTVVLSTSGSATDVKETFESGASAYVKKPHSFSGFILILKKIFFFHWAGKLVRPIWDRFFISEKNMFNEDH